MKYEVWAGYEDGTEEVVDICEREQDAISAMVIYRRTNRHEASKGLPHVAYWVQETI